jgi:glutamate--cysteine ligase
MPPAVLTWEICRNYIGDYLFGGKTEPLQKAMENIGLELESFPYTIDPQSGIQPVNQPGENNKLPQALITACERKGGTAIYQNQEKHTGQSAFLPVAITFPDGCNFQFEPGGQVEISTAPCNSLEKAMAQLLSRQEILQLLSQHSNIHFAQFGTNPWFTVEEIGMQMNKTRYRAMAQYFDRISSFGRQMMLQTCSLQVNLDTGKDWDTRVKRVVTANLLAPFAVALFANSCITAGKLNGFQSHRSLIWQRLDNTRTGVLPMDKLSKSLDKDTLIDAYLGFALKAPVIFIEEFGDHVFPPAITLEYWLTNPVNGLSPTLSHLKNHLSLLFPEVRLKGYMEIRSADAPPQEWQIIPALFYCGLLYNQQQLEKSLELLLPFASQMPSLLQKATLGLADDQLFITGKNLLQLSIEGLIALPASFASEKTVRQMINFSEKFTLQRKTFADECLDRYRKDKMFFAGK